MCLDSGQAVAADNNLHLQECQLVNRLGLALVFLFLCLLIWFYLKVCSCLLLPSLDHQVLHGLADLYPPPTIAYLVAAASMSLLHPQFLKPDASSPESLLQPQLLLLSYRIFLFNSAACTQG